MVYTQSLDPIYNAVLGKFILIGTCFFFGELLIGTC